MMIYRGVIGGETDKTAVLHGFCKIECGLGARTAPVPPLIYVSWVVEFKLGERRLDYLLKLSLFLSTLKYGINEHVSIVLL